MKQKLFFLVVIFSIGAVINAQTNIFPSSGNVGIGTTTPTYMLDVNGTGNILGTLTLSSPTNNLILSGVIPTLSIQSTQAGKDIYEFWSSYYTPNDFCFRNQTKNQTLMRCDTLGKIYFGGTVTALSFIKSGGTSSQFLKADGSVDSNTYLTTSTSYLPLSGGTLTGNLAISNSSTVNTLTLSGSGGTDISIFGNVGTSYGYDLSTTSYYGLYFKTKNSSGTGILFSDNGNVGIGSTNPDQKLTVNGKIHAQEVIVDLSVPADYVFAKGYELMPLQKVEQYVQQNSHLPEIPSAPEVKKNGLSVGEMQNKLLQKVEELTLYAIQQQKEIKELKEKVKQLETK